MKGNSQAGRIKCVVDPFSPRPASGSPIVLTPASSDVAASAAAAMLPNEGFCCWAWQAMASLEGLQATVRCG